ncbi:MAG: hypothetical protein JSV26_10500 [bacterium]|nr:MAG: hypothetical protein JSV26_10500 [bacterium]
MKPQAWTRMKRYSMAGWKHTSTKLFSLIFLLVLLLSALAEPPFWLTFSSCAPFLLIYFPLVGFFLDLLERDWKDWHLW